MTCSYPTASSKKLCLLTYDDDPSRRHVTLASGDHLSTEWGVRSLGGSEGVAGASGGVWGRLGRVVARVAGLAGSGYRPRGRVSPTRPARSGEGQWGVGKCSTRSTRSAAPVERRGEGAPLAPLAQGAWFYGGPCLCLTLGLKTLNTYHSHPTPKAARNPKAVRGHMPNGQRCLQAPSRPPAD